MCPERIVESYPRIERQLFLNYFQFDYFPRIVVESSRAAGRKSEENYFKRSHCVRSFDSITIRAKIVLESSGNVRGES